MGILDWLLHGSGHSVDELARRLAMDRAELEQFRPRYREFFIAKRSGGGQRRILAPQPELKELQRRILRRLLARLKVHPAAMGFERGRSIVTNAAAHQGRAVVIRFDIKDFFASTTTRRVQRFFRLIGFNRKAAALLTRLCTHDGGLPQGAPTSPRLSNLVNYRLDARLAGMAEKLGAVYTRYADDITLSANHEDHDRLHSLQRFVRRVTAEEGYWLHRRKKHSVRRRHHRQIVNGLVVNERVNLPREVRRWLRAVEHRYDQQQVTSLADYEPFSDGKSHAKQPTLTPAQLEGWQAYRAMVERGSPERR